MSSERQSARVFRDTLNLSVIGKRRLYRALIGSAADPLVMFRDLKADLAAVAGEVRHQHTSGDTNVSTSR